MCNSIRFHRFLCCFCDFGIGFDANLAGVGRCHVNSTALSFLGFGVVRVLCLGFSMGSTGEADRKRRHLAAISPSSIPAKKPSLLPISEDKKVRSLLDFVSPIIAVIFFLGVVLVNYGVKFEESRLVIVQDKRGCYSC